MAKCDLSVEIDNPDRIYGGGETIRGVVRVSVDSDVTCNGLEVKTVWRTHGRGNVATKDAQSTIVFTGDWQAGDQLEYPFELTVADWPPSYHGHYLNIDHYVDARAKIPWAFDPKASAPFLMKPTGGPEIASAGKSGEVAVSGFVGAIIALVFASILIPIGGALIRSGWFGALFFAPLLIGGIVMIVRYALPKYKLGKVTCEIEECSLHPGDVLRGELVVCPRRPVNINGVKCEIEARERCVSGSGSNATTHTHLFFSRLLELEPAKTLRPDVEHRYPIAFEIPSDAPYSIKLSSNEIIWEAKVRIDIPRCPDWSKKYKLEVLPSGNQVIGASSYGASSNATSPAMASATGEADSSSPGVTFQETVQHLWDVRDEDDQRDLLVDVVQGMTFDVEAIVERRVLYSGSEDPHVYENGHAVWARAEHPELPMVLYVPHDMGEEFEQIGRQIWRGRGTVVGWDHQHGRLQIKVETGR
ncbi:hypothetical protein N9N28_07490 [Rubripirellula amarantea]|uniref:Arrestin-like N-terminal domain-containing protein n=1 Tax=Rubripirellula amarantea TaxID=2527999 RepID=A0A5C5WQZ5_9BACT|nr:hypothetical protein [Rubripirellula amarantea]MDA8744458.1 hypothetical protein [Rubripirellula amarantea]TWT53314.1 hypothetical protein Pla22_09430 [Rubripirellula amarantea]